MMKARARWSLLVVPVLLALGCSDPVPLPAQGNLTLFIANATPSVAGKACSLQGGSTYEIGSPAPTPSVHGKSIIDGQNGASISCSVRGDGPYTFSGKLDAVSNDGAHRKVSIGFTDGKINADQLSGTVNVGVFTTDLATTLTSTEPCTLTVVNKQVKKGLIWASFYCPTIFAPPSNACGINGNSVIVFENCDGI